MSLFKGLLVALGVIVLVYTVVAVMNEGPNLFASTLPMFFQYKWPGQFFLDFLTYLWLSGLWVAWRHDFSGAGIVLGIMASLLGMIFLSVYLLIAINKAGGDMREVLLGARRALST